MISRYVLVRQNEEWAFTESSILIYTRTWRQETPPSRVGTGYFGNDSYSPDFNVDNFAGA